MIDFFKDKNILDILMICTLVISSIWFVFVVLKGKIYVENKKYCERCNKKTNYEIIDNVIYELVVKNKHIKFVGKLAVCSKCGHEVFDEYVEKYNQIMFEEAYRNRGGEH